jgi:cytochrome P460
MKRICVVLGLTIAACAPAESTPDADPVGDTFLAVDSSFNGFRTWEAFAMPPGENGTIHTAGVRTTYLNHAPKTGSTEFPVGTIIVKESEDGPIADRQVFARVKRGGGYNAGGAAGWEWFELKNEDPQRSTRIWRGVGPPVGEKYGGDPNGGCNGCHGAAKDNDYVLSGPLQLKMF